MEIETKFDIGDKVWRIRQRGKACVCPKCKVIHQSEWKWGIDGRRALKVVEVWAYFSVWGPNESYVVGPKRREHANMAEVFSTKAKAQAECDKRNEVANGH